MSGNLAIRAGSGPVIYTADYRTGEEPSLKSEIMGAYENNGCEDSKLLDATCRIALAGYLHDLGKFAERANMRVDREVLETNKQLYCPNPRPHPNSPGWFSHVHAAYTALALDALEPSLPRIKGADVSPFDEWGTERSSSSDNSLINAAAMHHKPDTFLQWIIATADRAASGLDRETFDIYNRDERPTTGKNHYTARQLTLFEQVDLNIGFERNAENTQHTPAWKYRYRLAPLSPGNIFPMPAENYETNDQTAARAEYAELWELFQEALGSIPASHRDSLSLWLDHFDSLWLTFTHAIPAATAFRTIPDVSLYDHSRVVAALAAAIWRYHYEREDDPDEVRGQLANRGDWDQHKLLFIQGDLFGIQDFIFASGGETTKRAAKLLRGRSFFVTLLTECAALRVMDALSLPSTSQIINAAGKFQIIAPNTSQTIEKLQEVRELLDAWFLQHTFGQSGIGIAWTPASCNDLQMGSRHGGPYQRLVKQLFEALEEAKLQRFDLCAKSAPPAAFDGYLDAVGKHGLCAVDGRSPADSQPKHAVALSPLARDQITIGELLTVDDRDRLLVSRDALEGPNVHSLRSDVLGFRIGFSGNEAASGRFGSEVTTGNLLRVWDFSLPKDEDSPSFTGYARRDINAWVPRFDQDDLTDLSRYDGCTDSDSGPLEVDALKDIRRARM